MLEECAEVQKEATKALRFGSAHRYPATGLPNREKLYRELVDLTVIIGMLSDAGVIPQQGNKREFTEKIEKVSQAMQLSAELGILTLPEELDSP